MPRWVVVSLWVVGAVVVLAAVAMLFGIGGEHGPGRHAGLPGSTVTTVGGPAA
jgi:hypothetical protein